MSVKRTDVAGKGYKCGRTDTKIFWGVGVVRKPVTQVAKIYMADTVAQLSSQEHQERPHHRMGLEVIRAMKIRDVRFGKYLDRTEQSTGRIHES